MSYTKDELFLKDGLERLFWIEIAKRRSRQLEPSAFEAMSVLRREIQSFFESRIELWRDDIDLGADLVLDEVQFHQPNLTVPDEQRPILQKAVAKYERRVSSLGSALTHADGFKWSDFSTNTDLALLLHWWLYINRSDTRRALAITKGKFSTIGELRALPDSEHSNAFTQSVVSCPVRIPVRVHRDGMWVTTTAQSNVTIDGTPIRNSVVLTLDLDAPSPSSRRLHAIVTSLHSAHRATRIWEQLQEGVIPPDLLSNETGNVDILTHHTSPPEEHQLMTAQNRAAPLIRGLYCFDLVFHGQSAAEAAAQTAEVLSCSLKSASNAYHMIRPRVDAYTPSSLPW